jgi:hypothetical protein|tara:strand:- start:254 stop:433 length:180 start_codon:yes stop_codon:yes gene_type:complete
MNCWHCDTKLIWGGDHDIEEDETYLFGEYSIVTNLSCPECDSYVLVYYPREEDDDKKLH